VDTEQVLLMLGRVALNLVDTHLVLTKECVLHKAVPQEDQQGDNNAKITKRRNEEKEENTTRWKERI